MQNVCRIITFFSVCWFLIFRKNPQAKHKIYIFIEYNLNIIKLDNIIKNSKFYKMEDERWKIMNTTNSFSSDCEK